jgi:hypothetical protein
MTQSDPTSFLQTLRLMEEQQATPLLVEAASDLMLAEKRFMRWISTIAKHRVRYADREACIQAHADGVTECASCCRERHELLVGRIGGGLRERAVHRVGHLLSLGQRG